MTPQVADPEKEPLKSALESLRESEEFNARLVESSRDCIKVLDLDERLLSINSGGMASLEICDVSPIIGTSWIDFWEGEDKVAAGRAVKIACRGGVGRFVGFFATRETNQPRWWDVTINAILGKDGRPEKLLSISRGVTELKQAEQRLRESRDVLERTVAERSIYLERTCTAMAMRKRWIPRDSTSQANGPGSGLFLHSLGTTRLRRNCSLPSRQSMP